MLHRKASEYGKADLAALPAEFVGQRIDQHRE